MLFGHFYFQLLKYNIYPGISNSELNHLYYFEKMRIKLLVYKIGKKATEKF